LVFELNRLHDANTGAGLTEFQQLANRRLTLVAHTAAKPIAIDAEIARVGWKEGGLPE
jgi:hypothetical protein